MTNFKLPPGFIETNIFVSSKERVNKYLGIDISAPGKDETVITSVEIDNMIATIQRLRFSNLIVPDDIIRKHFEEALEKDRQNTFKDENVIEGECNNEVMPLERIISSKGGATIQGLKDSYLKMSDAEISKYCEEIYHDQNAIDVFHETKEIKEFTSENS